jgi:hypothetical protein
LQNFFPLCPFIVACNVLWCKLVCWEITHILIFYIFSLDIFWDFLLLINLKLIHRWKSIF